MSSPSLVAPERGFETPDMPCGCCEHSRDSSDLVALKISLLGDSQIGKTSFLASAFFFFLGNTMYVGGERQEEGFEISNSGLHQMDKTLYIGGEHIACRIWEVAGDETFQNQIPSAYKDSVAMLFMFDLTKSRKWNQTAIPVLIRTKFNDFVQFLIDVQWTIASPLKATLFFSRATYNINVNKIFEFITAKLFNLPWAPEQNLTIGEPIINF
ncbi:Septum-promoting GTP-binding protein 1 [Camellia lanceoleosa]|uniref:Septum-promoting GTP-binding protein 1 n=1 Tax=Camellia lanceoleosa TaxID=1840588 RepID=A0ACC0HHC9_9ERIC|nr:Septum-promoting GTP-binding protein 1 [Camellia lanceoleosa]